jgi:hypothetical protein
MLAVDSASCEGEGRHRCTDHLHQMERSPSYACVVTKEPSGWLLLRGGNVHRLYSSPHITMIRSGKMRNAGHVARTEKTVIAYNVL